MKNIFITTFLLLFTITLVAQQPQYQTYTAILKIVATKDGEQLKWENKNILVRLDYKIGEFITRLKNVDFQNSDQFNQPAADSTIQEMEYTFKGIFPIRDIINQKQIKQQYTVELLLNNEELSIREPVLFDMTITRPSSGEGNYRVFSLRGKLYNDQLQLPAFEGFDDEIEIWLAFNGFMNTR